MRRLLVAVAAVAVAASLVVQADAARKPTPAETQTFTKILDAYWCTYLPKAYRPCSGWKVKVKVKAVSTFAKGWALAQVDATGPQPPTKTFAPFQNVFLHQDAGGTWHTAGWFDSLVYRTCAAAAKGTKVPEGVLDEFGLCDRLIVVTLGG
jgi:hypothetical protein